MAASLFFFYAPRKHKSEPHRRATGAQTHKISMSKQCPECGCPITDEAVCPECGCPLAAENSRPPHSSGKRIKRIYHKYFYTEEPDPYVDLAARLCSVPKVVTAIGFALYLIYILLVLIYSLFVGGFIFPSYIRSVFHLAAGSGIAALLLYAILWFGAIYLFWWWVGNIIVNGVRKIRQSESKQ